MKNSEKKTEETTTTQAIEQEKHMDKTGRKRRRNVTFQTKHQTQEPPDSDRYARAIPFVDDRERFDLIRCQGSDGKCPRVVGRRVLICDECADQRH